MSVNIVVAAERTLWHNMSSDQDAIPALCALTKRGRARRSARSTPSACWSPLLELGGCKRMCTHTYVVVFGSLLIEYGIHTVQKSSVCVFMYLCKYHTCMHIYIYM